MAGAIALLTLVTVGPESADSGGAWGYRNVSSGSS